MENGKNWWKKKLFLNLKLYSPSPRSFLQESLTSAIKSERAAMNDLDSEITRIERMIAHQRRAAAAKANPIAAMQKKAEGAGE